MTRGFPSLRPIEKSLGCRELFSFSNSFLFQCQLILGRIVGKREKLIKYQVLWYCKSSLNYQTIILYCAGHEWWACLTSSGRLEGLLNAQEIVFAPPIGLRVRWTIFLHLKLVQLACIELNSKLRENLPLYIIPFQGHMIHNVVSKEISMSHNHVDVSHNQYACGGTGTEIVLFSRVRLLYPVSPPPAPKDQASQPVIYSSTDSSKTSGFRGCPHRGYPLNC